jgi:hypothetical protein
MRHGQGVLTQADGFFYSGGWQQDKQHGTGETRQPTLQLLDAAAEGGCSGLCLAY